ncbi:MAG TPA: peptidyl-prolyl cis-trans isomerase [Vicinamibacterales bacterium]|nr:peptidyl-prolyl cis-trans isomerase [Vicinamibacterales bacterium]
MKFRVLVGSLAIVAIAGVGARAEIFEQILVKVNGDIFTKSDLEQRQVAMLRQKGEQFDPKNDPKNEQLRKALDEITPQIMVDVVDEMLLSQRGRELGYRLNDEQFKSVVDSIKKENKIETEEQFQAALKSENMTMADLRRNLEKSMIIQKVQQNEVMTKIGVTEEEARKYYESHRNEFTSVPSVTLREILVAADSKQGGDEGAQQRAQAIRARVTSGENFEKLAAAISDSASKANSGLIGPISLTDVSPDLKKVLDTMKPGDVGPVIKTGRGYQILKLETVTPARTLPFEQAREQISDKVFAEKRKIEYAKYLEKLRNQAIIEWKNPDVHRAFDEGLKQLQQTSAQ